MSVLRDSLPYYALIVLFIMSWSCWIDNDVIEVDSVICPLTCIVLNACGTSSKRDATFGRWFSPLLDSPVFCTCASTLFMREAICISFSSIVLVSLAMMWAISTNCSYMDVVSVAITGIVIDKGEVKESEQLE